MGALIRDMDLLERPRERLLANGSAALADSELVAILLRTGGAGRSAVALARELLREMGGLPGLVGIGADAVRRPGLGDAKAAAVLAAVEIARRLARAEIPDRLPLSRPEAVARYLAMRYGNRGQEVFGVLFLDSRSRLLAELEIFRGTLQRASVEPRQIFKEALLRNAASLIVFHNHPSGDPSPSAEDLAFTRRLVASGEVVGVRLLDHLILGGSGAWVSLRSRPDWPLAEALRSA